ncbi:unnamed protein product [Durusdinium trenchii]|uniref:Uncharacterized protein n=1 Tax=Durusdinium trenchii TaxID=1381693 RepID=A0ABP0PJ16_9DINO
MLQVGIEAASFIVASAFILREWKASRRWGGQRGAKPGVEDVGGRGSRPQAVSWCENLLGFPLHSKDGKEEENQKLMQERLRRADVVPGTEGFSEN